MAACLLLCEISELNVSVKRSCRLSRPPWFVERLEAGQLPEFIPFPTISNAVGSVDREILCVGVLHVKPGMLCSFSDTLPPHMSPEFELQWLAYHQPNDTYSAEITECFAVDEAFPIVQVRKSDLMMLSMWKVASGGEDCFGLS